MVALQAGCFFPRTARRENAARRRCCRSKGVFSFQREHPLWNPQRSAHLVEVHLIIVYRGTHQCGERSNAAFGKQSAAEQTSLAPHDSKARLRVVTTCRRFMAKPCTPHPTTRKGYATSVRQQSCQRLCNAQRVQFFELLSCNGGVKGQSPLRSLGGPRGPFSHVREWPPYPRPPARCRETVIILHNHNPHLRAADPRACTDQDIY